jgi:hypothetical protein
LAKIRTISKSHVVHPGLKVFRDKKEGEIRLSKEDVPGLGELGFPAHSDPLTEDLQPKVDGIPILTKCEAPLARPTFFANNGVAFASRSEILIIPSFSTSSTTSKMNLPLGHLSSLSTAIQCEITTKSSRIPWVGYAFLPLARAECFCRFVYHGV